MAAGDPSWSHINQPETLWDYCLRYISKHLQSIAIFEPDTQVYRLRDGLNLHRIVCESLFRECHENRPVFTELEANSVPITSRLLNDAFMHIFEDNSRTCLRQANVMDSDITDVGLEWLMRHQLTELNIDSCPNLTGHSLRTINLRGQQLTTLLIGSSTQILEGNGYDSDDIDHSDSEDEENGPVLKCPKLRALSIHGLEKSRSLYQLTFLVTPLHRLSMLDISSCKVEVHHLTVLCNLTMLYKLVLFDVHVSDIEALVQMLSKLQQLRVLDLSQKEEQPVIYPNPEHHLSELASNLAYLKHLDLSGTNLPGFQKPSQRKSHLKQECPDNETSNPPIPGLEGKELDFLGLMNCPYDACHRKNLPAIKVTGDANEEQVILAVQTYIDRPDQLLRALNALFLIFKFSVCHQQKEALLALLVSMKRHPYDKHIQISGSASLFYIVKGEEKEHLNSQIKRKIIDSILDGIENHLSEITMLRNGCLTLCHFTIPQDVLYNYKRVVRVLLSMVSSSQAEEFVQRIGIYLLNSLACQVDGQEKQLVGDLGAIQVMLDIIKDKLEKQVCDEIMEIAWSTMWNVTDETPLNCQRFLDGAGMELFVKCLKEFIDKDELLRNMMGLLGNVAEVQHLRYRLMDAQFVSIFTNLLQSTSDGIEVSYNACGVLAHMVSDGADSWTVGNPARHQVLHSMVTAIRRWNLETRRNINYRSFEPILRLLRNFETPESQHWAVWALANLTQMYKDKYCPLVESEGGVELLVHLTKHPRPYKEIKELAQQVVDRCHSYSQSSDGYVVAEDDEDNMDG